jgi:hypothetical protein
VLGLRKRGARIVTVALRLLHPQGKHTFSNPDSVYPDFATDRSIRRKAMAKTRPRYSKEEFARRGDTIFERDVRPLLQASDENKFVAIDIETGAYEVDADEQAASDRLSARVPGAQVWLRRANSPYARRFGGRRGPGG